MRLWQDVGIFYHLLLRAAPPGDRLQWMESFYAPQASGYDAFRRRFLHGRQELYAELPCPAGGVWVDLGGGTGACLEYAGDRLRSLRAAYIVDAAPSLLQAARRRIAQLGWHNVVAVQADARTFAVSEADVVTFSYSLTMMPGWRAALQNAWRMLKPGGTVGVVDFHVSAADPPAGLTRHGVLTRRFWPAWFGRGGVEVGPERLDVLRQVFLPRVLQERRGALPYLPFLKIPYFIFVAVKPMDGPAQAMRVGGGA